MKKREKIADSLYFYGYGLITTTANERAEHSGARWRVYEMLRDGSSCYIQIGAEHYFRTLADVEKFIEGLPQ